MHEPDELYVLARRVLLDALEALEPHLDALILVGSQAIYLRVGDTQLAVAPYTTDGDLAIDPSRLSKLPPLEQVLGKAGFVLQGKGVGTWTTNRSSNKDALDVYRLFLGMGTEELAVRLGKLLIDEHAGPVTQQALSAIEQQFGNRSGEGIKMVLEALEALSEEEETEATCIALARDLLYAVGRQGA